MEDKTLARMLRLGDNISNLTGTLLAETIFAMQTLTAILHRGDPDEGGFWATCPEVPGANGQGDTEQQCLADLADAVRLLWETERAEALRGDPAAREVALPV